ncbi:MAG TPA: glycoside hydrolase domain-containing protein [Gemmatimonadaceae bacterium]
MRSRLGAVAAVVARSTISRVFVVVALLAFACKTAPTKPTTGLSPAVQATARFAQAAATVTGQKSPMADAAEKGKHLGFDTYKYPGTEIMKIWKNTPGSPYKWVGFYLPSPCHSGMTWHGKRDTLVALGWGLAAIYVGQQTWGKTPRRLTSAQQAALRKRDDCSQDLLSAEEGRLNADDAVKVASAEGFPKGAHIFLDIERMETIPKQMQEYYLAWVNRMLETGQYLPAIYTHRHNAAEIFADVDGAFKAAGRTDVPRFWIAGGKNFDEGAAPQDVGFAFAGVWQGILDVARSVAQVKLPIDVNVAAWRSPSESGVTTE